MGNKQCYFTINELEVLMGLPPHYTDTSNLSVKERSDVLAKGWCVPVVEKILEPLTEIYLTKNSK